MARDFAGENRSPLLQSFVFSVVFSVVFSASAKLQRYPSAPKVCSTRVRVVFSAKLQRYPLFRASSRVRRGEPNGTTISLGALIVVVEDPEVLLLYTLRSSTRKNSTPPKTPPK